MLRHTHLLTQTANNLPGTWYSWQLQSTLGNNLVGKRIWFPTMNETWQYAESLLVLLIHSHESTTDSISHNPLPATPPPCKSPRKVKVQSQGVASNCPRPNWLPLYDHWLWDWVECGMRWKLVEGDWRRCQEWGGIGGSEVEFGVVVVVVKGRLWVRC